MCEKKIVNQKNHLQCRGVLQQQKKEIVPRNDLHQPLQEAKIQKKVSSENAKIISV